MSPVFNTLINGQPDQSLDPKDRGLAYGHGVFETISIRDGKPLAWQSHLQRLYLGAQKLGIPIPDQLENTLLQDLARLLQLSDDSLADRAVLKLILTRGGGGRGYAVIGDMPVNRIMSITPFPEYLGNPAVQGVNVLMCATQLARSEQLAGIKHLNRLEQVLARAEWDDPDVREGLVADTQGNLIEGTMSNVFWIAGNTLCTPDLSHSGVAGIIREHILQYADALGLEAKVAEFSPTALASADEVFICNSVIGIWPVVRCTISSELSYQWSPGPKTRLIQKHLVTEGIY